jgi:hypothetical protein
MNALMKVLAVAIAGACAVAPAAAQRADGDPGGRRMQGGGINYAPQPGVFVSSRPTRMRRPCACAEPMERQPTSTSTRMSTTCRS